MTIDELLKDKAIKPKEKTEAISKWILDKSLPVDELIAFADKQKDPSKATCIEAMEYANKILHADLEFSPISYLQKVYENKTGKILSDEQAVSIYKNTKPIFDKYGKDIEGSDEECLLIEELTPLLQ